MASAPAPWDAGAKLLETPVPLNGNIYKHALVKFQPRVPQNRETSIRAYRDFFGTGDATLALYDAGAWAGYYGAEFVIRFRGDEREITRIESLIHAVVSGNPTQYKEVIFNYLVVVNDLADKQWIGDKFPHDVEARNRRALSAWDYVVSLTRWRIQCLRSGIDDDDEQAFRKGMHMASHAFSGRFTPAVLRSPHGAILEVKEGWGAYCS